MQSNQLPPIQQTNSPFSRPPLTAPIDSQPEKVKALGSLPPLPPLSQPTQENQTMPVNNFPVSTPPINPVPIQNNTPTVIVKKSTNWLVIIAVAVTFFAIGMGVAYLIFTNRSSLQSNNDATLDPTITTEQEVTESPEVTTNADKRYISEDLKISFILPQGVGVEEVALPYNPEGCIEQSVSIYPKYNGIRVYYNEKELLFIGIDDYCNISPITEQTQGASVLYDLTIEDVTYKLLALTNANQFGYMRMPIKLGENSKVALDESDASFAIMRAQAGNMFTIDEFELAVMMIASIQPE